MLLQRNGGTRRKSDLMSISPMIRKLTCWINLCVTIISSGFAQSFKPEQIVRRGPGSDLHCMSPLISAYDEFPDSAFSASSVLLNKTDFQPFQARLTDVYGSKEHTSGYAWCPNSLVDEMLREWIQAEFNELVIVKTIFTAGRGDGNVKEFMPSFVLKYQREDNGTWYQHVKRDGTRVLKANSDPRNIARATLDSVVIAKRIRIYPYSRKGSRDVCLRFALYGCKFPDGVVAYTMPQGGLRPQTSFRSSSPIDTLEPIVARYLKDLTYDGQPITTTYQLTDGLGQLMDNVAFLGNLTRESDLHPSQPGFHFVGWPQTEHPEVELLFKFDKPRRFTWVRLFTFDSLVLRVRLFSHAKIEFSLDGKLYKDKVEFSTGRVQYYDPHVSLSRARRVSAVGRSQQARTSSSVEQDPRIYVDSEYAGAVVVELALGERIGRFVHLTLVSADSWTVLSEVQFNSTIVEMDQTLDPPSTSKMEKTGIGSNHLDKIQSVPKKHIPEDQEAAHPSLPRIDKPEGHSSMDASQIEKEPGALWEGEKQTLNDTDGKLVALLPVVIALGILLFLLPVVVVIWLCSRRHFKRKQFKCRQKLPSTDGGNRTALLSNTAPMVTSGTMLEAAKLLGNSPPDVNSMLVPQIRYQNGTYTANIGPRLNDPSTNTSNAANSILIPKTGTMGTMVAAPAPVAADKFDPASEAPQLYTATDGNYMSPEYASASVFEFPVQVSEAPSLAPTSGMENAPANNYHPSFQAYPTVSLPHAVPNVASGPNVNIYSGPASMHLGTGTIKQTSNHTTPNPIHRLQTTMGHHPAGLMFLGGLGMDQMDNFCHTFQPNTYNFPPEMGRPCNLYQPDHQTSNMQSTQNGNMHLPESNEPWVLGSANKQNAPGSRPNSAWVTDARGGTLHLVSTPIQQFTAGQTPVRLADLNQISPHVSPQHYFPTHFVLQPAIQPQQQFQSIPTSKATNMNEETHGGAEFHRGSPVGAASANVAYNAAIPDATDREATHSGLSIYSVCT